MYVESDDVSDSNKDSGGYAKKPRGVEMPCQPSVGRINGAPSLSPSLTSLWWAGIQGNILYIRLAEAPGSGLMYPRRAGLTTPQYLKDLSDAVIDIPKVVTSMPPAIKLAIVQSRGNKKA